jgi:hypothetical protein
MALWGNNDNVGSGGTVSLDYSTLVVTGTGTTFGNVGAAKTGDVIRFGVAFGVNIGDAVIVGIASTTQLSIASTAGLSGAVISGVQFQVSESPKYAVLDSHLNEVIGVEDAETEAAVSTKFKLAHAGWVGITTYNGSEGELRVKSEVLVAMSGITTGNNLPYPPF